MKRACCMFLFVCVALMAGCMTWRADPIPVVFMTENGRVFSAQRCERGRKLSLKLPDGTEYWLPKISSSSGVKYSDGHLAFWSKGDEGLILVDGKPIIVGLRFAGKPMVPDKRKP